MRLGRELRGERFDGGRSGFQGVGAVGARLHGSEVGRIAGEAHVHVELALKELAHQHEFAILDAMADHVADRYAAERGGQLRQKVAHLVGVREDHDLGARVFD